jgi:CHAD domain-containing protein
MKSPATTPPPAPPETRPPFMVYVERLAEELHVHVPKALSHWDEQAVHQARVATRRLGAALALVKPKVGKKKRKALAQVLRRLRRRLGPLRDADVMLGHLADLAATPKHAEAAEWLAGRIRAERDVLREGSIAQGPPSGVLADLGTWYPVREQIAESLDALPALLARSLHLQLDAFVEQADAVVRRSKDASSPGAPNTDSHDPHQVRIAGKALRYTLEMALAQGHALDKSVMKRFKRMQEALGAWHDFVVLTEKAMRCSLDATLPHHDPGTQEKVLELAKVTLRRAAQQLDQFGKTWSSHGEELARSIRAGFPITRLPEAAAPSPADRAAAHATNDAPSEAQAVSPSDQSPQGGSDGNNVP